MARADVFDGESHVCLGCRKRIASMEPHIHLDLDQWEAHEGLEALGLGDLFQFTFCQGCCEKSDRGWQSEAHPIAGERDGTAT